MKTMRALLLAGAAAGIVPGAAAAQDGASVLHAAAERYESVETLCADFTQHLEVPLLGSERTGTGRLCQGSPNLFAMRFNDPAGDLVVVDGEHAWVYFPSNDEKTVLKMSAAQAAGGEDFHREFLVDPEAKYEIEYEGEDEIDGRAMHRLRMTPLNPSNYRHTVLWVDQAEPVLRRLRMEQENGSVRTITLANVGFGAEPGADWFSFTPPDGALVMER
ncbi:MAG: outer membrane lipoprotein carrier protein LolA [Gemmatimonadota bacterium]